MARIVLEFGLAEFANFHFVAVKFIFIYNLDASGFANRASSTTVVGRFSQSNSTMCFRHRFLSIYFQQLKIAKSEPSKKSFRNEMENDVNQLKIDAKFCVNFNILH